MSRFDGDKTGGHNRADDPRQGLSHFSDPAPFQVTQMSKRRNDWMTRGDHVTVTPHVPRHRLVLDEDVGREQVSVLL